MEMSKSNLNEFLEKNKGYKVLKRCKDTTIIQLPSGELLKILDDQLLKLLSDTGFSLDDRLNEVKKITEFDNFALPNRKLENDGIVNSYTMPYIPGVDFTDYYENVYDLMSYTKLHSQIENNIKKGNKLGIVFPDLCTTENIRITDEGKVVFIDYDSLQINKMPAVGFSDFLGTPNEVLNDKYYNFETGLFTKEIDIKSAIFLYFVDVFGINLATINRVNPYTGQIVTLDDVFSIIKLQDSNIQQKVWKLFQQKEPNEFLGNDIYTLAEKYRLVESYHNPGIKQLIKK